MRLSQFRNKRPLARRIIVATGLMALALVALSACGPATPEPASEPLVQRPTFTPTSAVDVQATQAAAAEATALAMITDTPTATPTAIPTDTPLPTDTPAPTDTPVPPDTPAPPTATPRPQPTSPPAPTNTPVPPPPPPAGDAAECAALGGDGCKFKITGGPAFAANGGGELKLQLFFIHSGVDGGQPQGDYRVWLEKDGQKLPGFDDTTSLALSSQQGTLGKYNYEHKLGIDGLPGNTVNGNYVVWVLDGNRERDSLNFSFSVTDGQGEVWIQFDQA